MKEIKAFVQKEFLETTLSNLEANGAKDITVIRVDGFGALADIDKDKSHFLRRYNEIYSEIIKLEIICRDSDLETFIEIIKDNCHCGSGFEGMVYVYEVIQAINLKNSKKGDSSL